MIDSTATAIRPTDLSGVGRFCVKVGCETRFPASGLVDSFTAVRIVIHGDQQAGQQPSKRWTDRCFAQSFAD
jgi:hypothetical protein